MKSKKINKLIHKWLSIPLGLIISLLCFTGAALVFQQEILEWSNPSHYFVDNVKPKAIPLDELVPMVNAKLDDNSVESVKVTDDPERTYTMTLTEGFRISIFVDQYTGEIKGRYAVKEHGFFTVMVLHRWLMDDTRTWGKYTTGWATVLFIVIMVTGLCYTSKRSKESYIIRYKKGTGMLMMGLHNTLGGYAALVLIICSLSGLMWSFDWFRNGVFAICGAEPEPPKKEAPVGGKPEGRDKAKKPEVNTTTWQAALDNSMTASSNYDYVRISDGMVSAHPNDTYRGRVQDKLMFDKETGKITERIPFAQQDVKSRVWAWAYSLHVGDYWGVWSKIFTFIFCVIGGSLPLTGYYFSIKKWIGKRKRLQRKQ